MKNKLGMKVIGLVVFALLLAVNCAEKGTDADVNIPPNTFITNFQVDVSPAMGVTYNSRVSWKGSDVDGAVFWYSWRVIGDADDSLYLYEESIEEPGVIDTVNLSTWQTTVALNTELELDFPTFDKKYIFEVMAQDNDRVDDPTPAIDTISVARIRDFNYAPNTEIVTGPPDGATTGSGVHFIVRGIDIDGACDTIQYSVDGGAWQNEATDIIAGSILFNLRGLTNGAHTIIFKAVDNFRLEDPTPVSVSIIVDDSIEPELVISIAQDQTFVVPFTEPILESVTVDFTATVDFYYSYIDSFVVVSDLLAAPLNTAEPSFTVTDIASGSYMVNVTAYDIGGNSTSTGDVDFAVVELPAGDGILCINGVDWGTYGGEIEDVWEAGVPWGHRESFRSWDLFAGGVFGSWSDSLLGSGSVPTWMLDTTYFDAVSWMYNNYSGDDAFWYESAPDIVNFLEMGGNLFIGGRHGHYIFEGEDEVADFAAYCGYGGYTDGLSPSAAIAVHDSVADMSGAGLSFTNVIVTNHADAIQLYETDGGDAGLGWVILPNGAGGGGAVCYIGGRNYRWDNADLKDNLDVVHRYFFGIGN